MPKRNPELRAHLMERAKTGYRNCEIEDFPQGAVRVMTDRLQRTGKIFGARVKHKTVIYFDTPEKAARRVAVTPLRRARVIKPPPITFRIHGRSRVGWGKDDPMHITSETKVTICPPFQQARPWSNTWSPI